MEARLREKVGELKRPMDFVEVARNKGGDIDHNNGRWVVRHQGRTIGFSDHGNREYEPNYRRLLIKAFSAAGLLAILAVVAIAHIAG